MRVVAYCRVSTDKEDQKNSLSSQERHFKAYCKRNKLNLTKTYSDEGQSGTNVDRKGFQKLLRAGGLDVTPQKNGKKHNFECSDREPLFDLIVVKDVSRFSRNVTDGLQIATQLREKGVHILFESNGLNTGDLTGNPESVHMTLTMLFSMAEGESQMKSTRQRHAYKSVADQGIYRPPTLPFGYVKDINGEIVEDFKEAEIIRYIFKRIINVGMREITKELNEKGIKTRRNKEWASNAVKSIVENTLFYGLGYINKSTKLQLTSSTKRTPKDKWIPVPNAVKKPIVTYEEWQEANDAVASRKRNGKGTRQPIEYDMFRHKLSCGYCGGNLTRNETSSKGRKYYNYACTTRRNNPRKCQLRNVSFIMLERLFKETTPRFTVVAGFGLTDERILQAIGQVESSRSETIKKLQYQIRQIDDDIEEITDQIIKLKITAVIEKLEQRMNNKIEEKQNIEKQIMELQSNRLSKLRQETLSTKKELQRLAKMTFNEKEKIEVLKKITVYDDFVDIEYSTKNYNSIIEELNPLLECAEKITSTFEENNKSSRIFRSEQLKREYHEGQLESLV